MFKLRDFVRANNIGWSSLSGNVNATNVLKNNPEKINWASISLNYNAMELLENNPEKIIWNCLSGNPNLFLLDFFPIKK